MSKRTSPFHNADSILTQVDGQLFHQQRLTLSRVIMELEASGKSCEAEDLEGLEELMDNLAGYMADVLGKKEVLLVEEGDLPPCPTDNAQENIR